MTHAQRGAEIGGRAKSVSNQTKWLFALAVLITVVVVVPLTLLNMHSICKPLTRHSVWPRPLQAGICRSPSDRRARRRWQTRSAPWTKCSEGLGPLVAQVRDASGNIATASQEIATATRICRHRTEQTASNAQAGRQALSAPPRCSKRHRLRKWPTSWRHRHPPRQRAVAVVAQAVSSMHEIRPPAARSATSLA